jgi:hypothetical protein
MMGRHVSGGEDGCVVLAPKTQTKKGEKEVGKKKQKETNKTRQNKTKQNKLNEVELSSPLFELTWD